MLRRARPGGLVLVPIDTHLRYSIPPRRPEEMRRLDAVLARPPTPEDRLLVYADDLEKAAGTAGWEPALPHYVSFLQSLRIDPRVEPVLLADWLRAHPPAVARPTDPGRFYELAQGWGAGEDYRG